MSLCRIERITQYVVLTFLLAVCAACGGGGSDGGGTPPPASVTPAPTVNIAASKSAARVGDSVTVSWTSTNADSCSASGAWSGSQSTSGSISVNPSQPGSMNYQLSCSGKGGAGSASVAVNVGSAISQVTVPGLPTPVAIASGDCVPSSDANFTITCITSPGAVPSVYDTFSSSLSGQVILNGSGAPTVNTGGDCSGGYDPTQSQLALTTSFGNEALPFTGSEVMEIVYSPAFLASLGVQSTITTMKILVFVDTSNSNHLAMVVYANGPSGPLTFAIAGTVSPGDNLQANIKECLGTSAATPSPPPAQSTLACSGARGSGQNGLGFPAAQSLTYDISTSGGSTAANYNFQWGIAYNNPQFAPSSYTGSLRGSLWAVPYNFTGSGIIQGYLLAQASPNLTGSGAYSSNQLYNGYTVSNIQSAKSGNNPPAGRYCVVLALEQYNSAASCSVSDHFCYVDWAQFPQTLVLQ